MHPAFQRGNVNLLPRSIREVANAACGTEDALEHVLSIVNLFPHAAASQVKLLLPVLYVNLDEARIPSPDELESFLPQTSSNLMSAGLALDTIQKIRLTLDIGLAIWPRVWSWLEFFESHQGHFPPIGIPSIEDLLINFLVFSSFFHGEGRHVISSTVGLRRIVFRAWVFLPRLEAPNMVEVALFVIHWQMGNFPQDDQEARDETVAATGGNVDSLAGLVVDFLQRVCSSPLRQTKMSFAHVMYLRAVLLFLNSFDFHPTAETGFFHLPLGPLTRAAVYHDFTESLVDAMSWILQCTQRDKVDLLEDCFKLLARILSTDPGYLRLSGLIEKGLLRVVLSCATLDLGETVPALAKSLLRRILPGNLVYYFVVVQTKDALIDLEDLVSSAAFKASGFWEPWDRFASLAKTRIRLLDIFSSDLVLMSACDNDSCVQIRNKSLFQRCSGCRTFYYCSQACQVTDWYNGGHRRVCASYGKLGLTARMSSLVVPRERWFLRALLDEDYHKHRAAICAQQVEFLTSCPACTFYTSFDYTNGDVKIEVRSPDDTDPVADILRSAGAEWTDILRRAVNGDGSFQLHIVQIMEGNTMRVWVVPLRTNGSPIPRRLREVAMSIGREDRANNIADEIDNILRNSMDVLEIH
ncbi:hypothetical protein C8R43DRAFT_639721 [Mycena crocata]|nr:hypothetical protein C8R43DRAFT_639721 [Mycena crocata]